MGISQNTLSPCAANALTPHKNLSQKMELLYQRVQIIRIRSIKRKDLESTRKEVMFVFFLFASAAFASASPLQKLPFSSIPMDQLVVPAGVKGCSTTFFDSGQMWLACDGKNVAYFTGVNHVEKSMLLAKMFDAELPLISCSASSEIEFDEDEDDYVSSTEESCFFQKKVP